MKAKLPANFASGLTTLFVRMGLGLTLLGSIGLAWWSVNRLPPLNRRLKQTASEVSALGNELQQLEQTWDPAEAARIESRFKQAIESVFAGSEESVAWLNTLQKVALTSSLPATLQPGASQPHPRAEFKLLLTPTTINLQPSQESLGTNLSYQRLLTFTKQLQPSNRRIDLLELHVFGGSNSVREATAMVQLWSNEEKSK